MHCTFHCKIHLTLHYKSTVQTETNLRNNTCRAYPHPMDMLTPLLTNMWKSPICLRNFSEKMIKVLTHCGYWHIVGIGNNDDVKLSTFIRASGGRRLCWQLPIKCGVVPSLRRLLHPWSASTKAWPQPLPPVSGEAGRLWGKRWFW